MLVFTQNLLLPQHRSMDLFLMDHVLANKKVVHVSKSSIIRFLSLLLDTEVKRQTHSLIKKLWILTGLWKIFMEGSFFPMYFELRSGYSQLKSLEKRRKEGLSLLQECCFPLVCHKEAIMVVSQLNSFWQHRSIMTVAFFILFVPNVSVATLVTKCFLLAILASFLWTVNASG